MLENRMRKPSKPGAAHEESLRTIKSTDSKRVAPIVVRLEDPNEREESQLHAGNILSDEQMRCNRKITDYLPFKKPQVSPPHKLTGQMPFKMDTAPQQLPIS